MGPYSIPVPPSLTCIFSFVQGWATHRHFLHNDIFLISADMTQTVSKLPQGNTLLKLLYSLLSSKTVLFWYLFILCLAHPTNCWKNQVSHGADLQMYPLLFCPSRPATASRSKAAGCHLEPFLFIRFQCCCSGFISFILFICYMPFICSWPPNNTKIACLKKAKNCTRKLMMACT